MGAAAVRLGEALGYVGAGTVEFILGAEGEFWFLELNARIQVEHPVTELVTGIDLVEQQLRVAAGERIAGLSVDAAGHAIEARLYAEHPLTFLPQAGRVERLELPEGVRIDAGVEAGDEVPVAYDPMIAKLVAHAETREGALDRLAQALRETHVGGVTTNLAFLRWAAAHPVVGAGEVTTAFLEEHAPFSRPRRLERPWRGGFRLNLPPAKPAPAPVLESAEHAGAQRIEGENVVVAPMPGTVIRVLAREGDDVEARDALVVLEAMKMETPVAAPYGGRVTRVLVEEGQRVAGGALLVELGAPEV
jgi:acetyl/propionyl-CoA carboxylase alpha subunit